MHRKHELDLDLRGSSWSYTKMRFVKPALRWIHVYQLCFKINFRKNFQILLLKTSIKYKLWFQVSLKNELRHDELELFDPWSTPPAEHPWPSRSIQPDVRVVRYDPKIKNEGEMKSRNGVIRDSLWHYINQCNTSCWAVTQMTQMG